jgi:hypothetical protein
MNVSSSCPSSSLASGRSHPSPMFVLTSVWPSSTWEHPLPLPRLSSPRPPSGRPLRPHLRLCLHAIIRPLLDIMLLLDSNPVAPAAAAAAVGAALAAPKAVHRAVLPQPHHSGPRCSTPGPALSTCGQGPPPAAPVALHHALSSLHLYSRLWWPACHRHTSLHRRLPGPITHNPLMHPLLGRPGRPRVSPAPSAPSPSPHHQIPQIG